MDFKKNILLMIVNHSCYLTLELWYSVSWYRVCLPQPLFFHQLTLSTPQL